MSVARSPAPRRNRATQSPAMLSRSAAAASTPAIVPSRTSGSRIVTYRRADVGSICPVTGKTCPGECRVAKSSPASFSAVFRASGAPGRGANASDETPFASRKRQPAISGFERTAARSRALRAPGRISPERRSLMTLSTRNRWADSIVRKRPSIPSRTAEACRARDSFTRTRCRSVDFRSRKKRRTTTRNSVAHAPTIAIVAGERVENRLKAF